MRIRKDRSDSTIFVDINEVRILRMIVGMQKQRSDCIEGSVRVPELAQVNVHEGVTIQQQEAICEHG